MNTIAHQVSAAVLLLSATLIAPAMAEDEPAKPAPGTLAGILDTAGITVTGFVAASYYHSNGYSTFHQFDDQHDTFQLDQAALQVGYQPKEGFGAFLDVRAGEDMRVLHTAEDGRANTFDIVQGYVQYATGPLTIIAGKYVTLVGAEVIAPIGNTNFSRSLLFFAEPLTHTGIRATYALTDTVNVIAGANNGWNTTSTSYGSKTGEVGIGWTPNKAFAITGQAYVGKEASYDALRTLIDVVATYNVTDSLNVIVSYDWGKQKQAGGAPDLKWDGVAAYVNYALSDQWRVSLRGEYVDDKDGFISGTDQKLKEATLTFGYAPVKSFELRIEGRYDESNQPTFVKAIAGAENVFSDNQSGFAVQGVFKF